jgi:protein SCO1
MKSVFKILTEPEFIFLLFLFFAFNSAYADYNSAEIVQHLGDTIPLNLTFVNSEGEEVQLQDLINKPTVLDFCYYQCAGICTPLMLGISDVVKKVKYIPGKDYDIISISIDQNETTEMAAQRKRTISAALGRDLPDSVWAFLTGDSTNIYKLTDAAGFHFQRTQGGILHKGVLVFLDKAGKIIRYLDPGYNQDGSFRIIPSTFEMAIKDAATGTVTPALTSILKTCSSFIPKGKDMLILLLVLGSGILTTAFVFIIIKKAKVAGEGEKHNS